MKQVLLAVASIAMNTIAIYAQKPISLDKIVAVIGDKIILESDVKNRIDDMRRNGVEIPPNAQCYMLESMLASKVLAQQAIKDSLPVSDEDVEAALDLRVRQFEQQFGSKEEVERIAGKTIFQLKEDSREQVREQKLAEEMQKEIMRTIKVTPTEVKDYFEKLPKESLTYYESQVELGQIVLIPKASREVVELAKEELMELKQRLLKGEKFEKLAKTNSDDPGTKSDGGLFTFKKSENNVDPEFKIASIKLKNPGDISSIIKSQFGYHLIQLVEKNGDDITVRHILKIPYVSQSEFTKAINKLDTIRSKLIAGTLDWGAAVDKYTEDEMSKFTAGMVLNPEDGSTFLTIDRFPDKDVVLMMKSLTLGEFSKPMQFVDQRNRKAVRLVYLKSRTQPHVENLRDDYSKISIRVLEEKKSSEMEKWIAKKLPTYYINVSPEFSSCEQVQNWVRESAKIK
jgi:peptidyl-prolyl cis-trans isomerase SurA